MVVDPRALMAAEVLDGVSSGLIGVAVPLVVADLTWGSGRTQTALGTLNSLQGLGGDRRPGPLVAGDAGRAHAVPTRTGHRSTAAGGTHAALRARKARAKKRRQRLAKVRPRLYGLIIPARQNQEDGT
jgi:hypothetical protein